MFATLLSSLTTLRDFFSRSFFVAAYLPTLMFLFVNGLILFVWNWPFHDWVRRELLDPNGWDKTVAYTILFFAVWLASYLVSALTPLWTRTLEGKNWWGWLRAPGVAAHLECFDVLDQQINVAVATYADIQFKRSKWRQEILKAKRDSATTVATDPPPPATKELIKNIKNSTANSSGSFTNDQLEDLVRTYCAEIRATKNAPHLDQYASEITLLIDKSYRRALQDHFRLITVRNLEYGSREEVAPTRFGNVGLSAQAFAMRAYQCNLSLIWGSLRRAAAKETDTATTLENCKSQLDFFVACFWLSLVQALGWAVTFTICGEAVGAISSALAGPAICWLLWYGAAVEQNRVLQSLLISALNSPLRFQVLADLRLGLPANILEERELWQSVDLAVSFGDSRPLRYQYPTA